MIEEKAFPQLVPGQQIDQYVLEEQIGSGGMGVVFAARQAHMDRRVAIKFLPDVDNNVESVRRFEREVRMISQLEHPHILPVYAYGEAFGAPYIVMRYMPGGTLTDQVNKGAITLQIALKIIDQVSGALDYAHEQTIIHRDIKPSNIFLDERYYAYLADFGLAKTMTGDHDLTKTEDGISGTPDYMSPEQVRGIRLDGRADIYSLGIICFQLLSGRLPYMGKSPMDTVMMQINAAIPSMHQIVPLFPPEIDTVFQRVLAKKVSERYENAKGFADDLNYVLRDVDKSLHLDKLTSMKPAHVLSPPTEVSQQFEPEGQETRENQRVSDPTIVGVRGPVVPTPTVKEPAKPAGRNLLIPILAIATVLTGAVLAWLGYEIFTNPFRNIPSQSYSVNVSPFELLLDDQNRLWIAGINQELVLAVNGDCRAEPTLCAQPVTSIGVDSRPHQLALGADGRVLVGHQLNAGLRILAADGSSELIDVKEIPTDFVVVGQNVWMTSGRELLEVDQAGEILFRVEVGALPRAVAVLNGDLWVAVEGDGRLKAIDLASKTLLPDKELVLTQSADRFIPLIADAPSDSLFAALSKDNLVNEVDGSSGEIRRQYTTLDRPIDLWIAFDKLWVLNESGVDIFNLDDGQRLDRLILEDRPSAAEMIICGEGCAELWIAYESSQTVEYYDLSSALDGLDRFTILP